MKYTFLFILLLSFFSIKAQTTSLLLGRVLDEKNLPIASVDVKITYSPWNMSKTTVSDKKGFFSASNLSPGGPYTVKFSCNEYEDQIRELSSLDLGSNNLSLHMRKIKIVDELTNETLVGVKNGNTYSDLDGMLLVDKDKPIYLEFISYEKLNTIVKNDTIIKMSSVK